MPSLRSWFNLDSSTHCRHCRGGGGGGGGAVSGKEYVKTDVQYLRHRRLV